LLTAIPTGLDSFLTRAARINHPGPVCTTAEIGAGRAVFPALTVFWCVSCHCRLHRAESRIGWQGEAASSALFRLAVTYNDALDRCTLTGGWNIDAVMSFFADDAVRIVTGVGDGAGITTQVGKEAIRAGFLQRAARLQQRVELTGTVPRPLAVINVPDGGTSTGGRRSDKVKKVEALIRPDKLQAVQDALDGLGTSGVTVTEVMGCGAQRGYTETYRGARANISLQRKIKVEAVVGESLVEAVIEAIGTAARSGEVGDGKIFVIPVDDAVRIRTGERGDSIVRHLEPGRWGH